MCSARWLLKTPQAVVRMMRRFRFPELALTGCCPLAEKDRFQSQAWVHSPRSCGSCVCGWLLLGLKLGRVLGAVHSRQLNLTSATFSRFEVLDAHNPQLIRTDSSCPMN